MKTSSSSSSNRKSRGPSTMTSPFASRASNWNGIGPTLSPTTR